MLDPLATPWSGHRGLPLPTVLPSATGVPATALVEVAARAASAAGGAVTGTAGGGVLLTPWSSYQLPVPAAVPVLPVALVPRPRRTPARSASR